MKYSISSLGDSIRSERNRREWTQEDLITEMAEKGCGIGRNTLSKLENGDIKDIKLNQVLVLCDIFNCDIGYLLGDYSEKTVDLCEFSAYTGLTENTLLCLHGYRDNNDDSYSKLISSFLDYLLDYNGLVLLLINFEQYIHSNELDGYICDATGKCIGLFTDDVKYLLIQQAFKEFLSFASDRKRGKEPYSKSKAREDSEKYTTKQKQELAAEFFRMINKGK